MFRLKELRETAKISQMELAQKLGVKQSTISTWERGRRDPDTDTVKKLAEIFGVSIDYLLELNNDNEKASPEEDAIRKKEVVLIENFKKLPEEQQAFVLRMVQAEAERLTALQNQ